MRAKLSIAIAAALLVGAVAGASLRNAPAGEALAQLDPAAPAHAQPGVTGVTPELLSFADIAERVSPAVVTVSSEKRLRAGTGDGEQRMPQLPFGEDFFRFLPNPREDQRARGSGSGFIVESDGLILTNNHVVNGADKIVVLLQDGRELAGKIVGTDPKTDVALVRVEARGLPVVRLGDDTKLRVGEWVLAIGSPFGPHLEHSVTAGIISAKGRASVGIADYEDFLQTDAAINPGNSGGPLVNLRGEVIGVNTAIASRSGGYQGVGFAIPITMAKDIMDQLVAHGKVTRAWMGVSIQDLSGDLARGLGIESTEGVVVAEIVKDSPAERAGIREGDVILSLDGTAAGSVPHFRNRVSRIAPGKRVKLDILREGDRRSVEVQLDEFPDDQVASRGGKQPDADAPELGLGLELANVTATLANQYNLDDGDGGIVVTDVQAGSPAAMAGIRPGDVVRGVNRKRVASVREFKSAVGALKASDPVVLLVRRNERSFCVTLSRES
jgi:serine protease Do